MAEMRVQILFTEAHAIWLYHPLSPLLVIFLPPDHYPPFRNYFSSWFKLFLSISSDKILDDFTVLVDESSNYAGLSIPWSSHLQCSSPFHPSHLHPNHCTLSDCFTSKLTNASIWLSDHNLISFDHCLWWLILCINLVRLWCPAVWSSSLDVAVKIFFGCH